MAAIGARPNQSVRASAVAPPSRPHSKKKRFRPSEQFRIDVHDRRVRFARWARTALTERLIFLDESGCNLAMSPTHGWSPRGARVYDHRPTNWGGNITAIAAIREGEVVCQDSYSGAMNTARFVDFITRRLCPRLRPDDIVVMDNLLPHKAPRVRALVEAAGAQVMFLPPYSPDMNPIEPLWGFVKNRLRRAKERTVHALTSALRRAVRSVPVAHLAAWFRHCGFLNQRKRSRV